MMTFMFFLEYYLTLRHSSWLTDLCGSLTYCFVVVVFNMCPIYIERSRPFEFAKVISKKSPSRKENHLKKKSIQGP